MTNVQAGTHEIVGCSGGTPVGEPACMTLPSGEVQKITQSCTAYSPAVDAATGETVGWHEWMNAEYRKFLNGEYTTRSRKEATLAEC